MQGCLSRDFHPAPAPTTIPTIFNGAYDYSVFRIRVLLSGLGYFPEAGSAKNPDLFRKIRIHEKTP